MTLTSSYFLRVYSGSIVQIFEIVPLMVLICLSGVPSGADVDGITAAPHRGCHSIRENSEAVYEESEQWER